MSTTLALLLLFANPAEGADSTPPRYRDADPAQQQDAQRAESPDPLFDRAQVATDDPAFVLSAVENARQGVVDAKDAATRLTDPELRAAAQKIGAHNQVTVSGLEKVAQARGWRLPQANPGRQNSVSNTGAVTGPRANANFIIQQITVHQQVVDQYRAQLAGNGDAQLKRALRESLPGYERNLELLLKLKP